MTRMSERERRASVEALARRLRRLARDASRPRPGPNGAAERPAAAKEGPG